jgi:oxygen-independent coproporphyrinogen-3 oxidase
MNNLIEKYNVAAPRYTSYPTVPYWDPISPTVSEWEKIAKNTFDRSNEKEGVSLYIHLPFCESLCTYCGCNTRITINHGVERPYLDAVLKEWDMYLSVFERKPRIKEIHLGGGTPTFFKPENLELLLKGILSGSVLCEDAELSFEGHPANTTMEHLEILYSLGFKRLSLGIQDFDSKVQDIINRFQTFEQVKYVTEEARRIGYTSVNYDLIYGLPLQTAEGMKKTIEKVIKLLPDRIAFYSYAHVPWVKPGQRKFTEADLPSGEAKRKLYESGRSQLENAGYHEIGMDHFALLKDSLHEASRAKRLHRNFMGYTNFHTELMIGLGVSSISDAWNGFAQNEKKVEDYYKRINKGEIPVFKGHVLSDEDLIIRRHILNIMCRLETNWKDEKDQCPALFEGLERLSEMIEDGLVVLDNDQLRITPAGRPFLRNACMALDARLWRNQPETTLFSAVI